MESLAYVEEFHKRPQNELKGDYEHISDIIYEKEIKLFNQINEYLITQGVINSQKEITLNDSGIKDILVNSKELDSNSPYYDEMLVEWVDKYNEDYIDRNNGSGYKFDFRVGKFVLVDTTERDMKFENKVLSGLGQIKSSSSSSVIDVFKSLIPNTTVKSESEKVKTINLNIKTMINNIGKKTAMFGL